MEVQEILDELMKAAKKDAQFRKELIDTRLNPNPLTAFCRLSAEKGFPLWEMDLLAAGEEAYAAMKRSTNGGGENSPMLSGEDDYYGMFLAELERL